MVIFVASTVNEYANGLAPDGVNPTQAGFALQVCAIVPVSDTSPHPYLVSDDGGSQ